MVAKDKKIGPYNARLKKAILILTSLGKDMSNKAISDSLELTKGTVSEYMRGVKEASPIFLEKFENYYGVKLGELDIEENGSDIIAINGDQLILGQVKTPDITSGVNWEKEYWKLKSQFDKLFEKVTTYELNSNADLKTDPAIQALQDQRSRQFERDSKQDIVRPYNTKSKEKKDTSSTEGN